MRCTCRRCVVTGPRQASLRHMAAGGTRFKSSSRGLPPRSPDSTPVCAISMSSIPSSGLPEDHLESRSWPAPVSRHRNFRRSATGGTSPDQSSGWIHARHRPDEGVRQSRPGHPGVGRFGSCSPRRSPEDRTAAVAFPRRPAGDTVGGRQPPRTEFHAFSLSRRRVDPVVHLILGTPSAPVRRGRNLDVFLLLRTARGVSIPERDVHGFLLRPLRTGRDLRFSEVRVAVA